MPNYEELKEVANSTYQVNVQDFLIALKDWDESLKQGWADCLTHCLLEDVYELFLNNCE